MEYMLNSYVFHGPIKKREYLARDVKFHELVGVIHIATTDNDKFQDVID